MKNTTKQNKPHNFPSEKTRWAYWMQAIEPKSEAINKAFPDYHPQWVQLSQKLIISPYNFRVLRNALGLNQKQCAAYLRIHPSYVSKWEGGVTPVPFAEFELLRIILESVQFRITHAKWDGWFISKDGSLNSPDIGGKGFTPEQLVWSTTTRNEAALLRIDVDCLQAELNDARAENTKLRQMYVAQGVVEELAAMKNTINHLMERIATAKVIPFPATAEQPMEKTA
jgi:DNA-binding transcriptional regulator YiaG